MLHLVQSVEGEVSADGINACAEVLGISPAEATGVATFYTMYKRSPVGRHHIGVCTNTLCGLLGGDAVYDAVNERLGGVGHNAATDDGEFWLERIECQAACTHAPVMTVDWEYIDDITPAARSRHRRPARRAARRSARRAVRRSGTSGPASTRWPSPTTAWPREGTPVDAKMLVGLNVAKERGMTRPDPRLRRADRWH